MKFIIAKCNEDLGWQGTSDYFVIQKGEHMPNLGREPASYFWYILTHYEVLEGDYVFCQARPFDHDPNFLLNAECKNYYGQVVTELAITETNDFVTSLGYEPQKEYWFKAGCQYKLSAKEIKAIPYIQYAKMFLLAISNDKNPYIFERIMPIIYPQLCKN